MIESIIICVYEQSRYDDQCENFIQFAKMSIAFWPDYEWFFLCVHAIKFLLKKCWVKKKDFDGWFLKASMQLDC